MKLLPSPNVLVAYEAFDTLALMQLSNLNVFDVMAHLDEARLAIDSFNWLYRVKDDLRLQLIRVQR